MSDFVLGIDLGTTNSCAAIRRQKRNPDGRLGPFLTEVLTDYNSGTKTVPSAVWFKGRDFDVGLNAHNKRGKYPEDVVFDAKRFIGRRFTDQVVQNALSTYDFNIVDGGNDDPAFVVNYRNQTKFKPEEIGAKILTHIKNNATSVLGVPVTKSVITVPAYFNDDQRQATKRAAQLAGFHEVTLINEPTAAALSLKEEDPNTVGKKVLVFDFGGGTFDVSIVKIGADDVTVIGTHGNTDLGGSNIDQAIVDNVKKELEG
ncbi:hypothetical protein GEMRC1_006456 [Eukaryota sp. GEM-RC1]